MKQRVVHLLGLGLVILLAQSAWVSVARADAPDCLDNDGSVIDVNNSQVIDWKTTTKNEYLNRAHVTGTVYAVYHNETGHAHFGIQLNTDSYSPYNDASNDKPTLEVIYDLGFGSIPTVKVGDKIEACGDYITSYAASGHYQASPDGALIHWIHKSDEANHPDGYLMINGELYGQELPHN